MIKKITCIECPIGCEIEVDFEGDKVLSVKGNTCKRGEEYATNEIICPKRVVTSTVRLASGGVLPVKTSAPVKKENIFIVMQKINSVNCLEKVKTGDIIVKDIEPGVDLVATADCQEFYERFFWQGRKCVKR